MSILFPRGTTTLYKVVWALLLPAVVLYFWLMGDYFTHPFATGMYGPAEYASPLARAIFTLICSPVLLAMGMFIMRRVPGNVVGPLVTFLGLGVPSFGIGAHSDPLLAVLETFMIPVFWGSLIYVVLFFPDGRAYPRWAERPLTVTMVLLAVTGVTNGLALPVLNTYGPDVPNILYTPGLVGANQVVNSIGLGATMLLVLGVFLMPALRYRATWPGSRERQQVKWLVFCAAIFATCLIAYVAFAARGAADSPSDRVFRLLYIPFVLVFPPAVLGIAILRHRLWDIDIIIRRTLVYSTLTAMLALTYWGGVVGLQALLRPITGEGNDFAIVATTLAVAALFLPLRRLIQGFIDRRFYRRKYDAARTLQAFSEHVRDEVNLNSLTGHLVQVVDDTMRPEHMSLWLNGTVPGDARPAGRER